MPENQDDPVAVVDTLFDRLVSVLSGGGASGRPTTGTAEDDAIVVTLGADGRVQQIDIDPRMRRRPEAIAPGIVAATNAARHARPDGDAAPGALTADLRAIQEESVTATQQINSSLLATLEKLKRT